MLAMPTLFAWLLRYIGWPGILLGLFYVYEEGIPGAHKIPFLTSIPVIGDLTTGRVHTYADQQVKLATKDMVTRFERDALASQLAAERKRAADAALVAEEFRRRYVVLDAMSKINREKAEKDIAEDDKTDGGARVTRDDLDWRKLRHW